MPAANICGTHNYTSQSASELLVEYSRMINAGELTADEINFVRVRVFEENGFKVCVELIGKSAINLTSPYGDMKPIVEILHNAGFCPDEEAVLHLKLDKSYARYRKDLAG